MSETKDTIIQIVAAAPGWRLIRYHEHRERFTAHFEADPIAFWVLVERAWEEDGEAKSCRNVFPASGTVVTGEDEWDEIGGSVIVSPPEDPTDHTAAAMRRMWDNRRSDLDEAGWTCSGVGETWTHPEVAAPVSGTGTAWKAMRARAKELARLASTGATGGGVGA